MKLTKLSKLHKKLKDDGFYLENDIYSSTWADKASYVIGITNRDYYKDSQDILFIVLPGDYPLMKSLVPVFIGAYGI